MQRSSQAQPRAPPLEANWQTRPRDPIDRAVLRRRLAMRIGLWSGAVWSGTLAGVLLGLGRVPWPEALLWSFASGIVVWRSLRAFAARSLDHLLQRTTIELGMQDPHGMRTALERALPRRGYRLDKHTLHADTYVPRREHTLLPPVRIAWSGPGAIVEGPRWLVRLAARLAVG